MDLRQLEIVRAIAETGSFTGAGRKLHVSQSAISRQVLLLEGELQEPLFVRTGRRVRITHAGDALLKLGHRVFADIKDTVTAITDTRQDLSGTLKLSGGMTVCLYVFPLLLKEYLRLHPRVEIKVTTGATPRLLRRLRTGATDLALLTLPLDEPDIVTMPVMREELLLVTDPTHPLTRRPRIGVQDLARLHFVLFEPGSNSRRVVEELFIREQIQPRIVMETENVEILKALVRAGLGVSILPYLAVAREVKSRHLFCSRISGAQLVRQTGWAYLRTSRLPRMVDEMFSAFQRIQPRLKPGLRNLRS